VNALHETPATDLPPVLPAPGAMPGSRYARWWLVAAWCAWSTAGAQTPDERALLGEVPSVFAASKYDQPLSEAPADVSIVTRAEIQRYGWLTLADVLRGVRGFLVTSDRNYSYAGVRGFARTGDYNGRILLTVDGHRVNDSIYDQALLGNENPIDIDLVERVEIVRGAGSSVYGSNALFGVINLITRRGRDVGGAEAALLAGTQKTLGGRITAGDRVGKNSEYLLSLTGGQTDGDANLHFPAFNWNNGGMASDSDAERWVKALAQWRTGDFSLAAVYASRTKQLPTAPFNAVFNDNRNETTDARAWVEGRYDGHVMGGDLRARVAYDEYRYEGNLVQSLVPDVINEDRTKGTWWSGEVTYSRSLQDDLTLLVGAEVQSDLRNVQENGDSAERGGRGIYSPYFYASEKSRYWALFAQAEWRIAPGWDATIGVRHDAYASFGGVTDPRLALIHTPSRDLTLKLIYGQAFRAPNDYELYYNDGGVSQKANPDLSPERVRSAEALAEWRFAPGWRAVGAFYFNRITAVINTVTDSSDGLLVNVNSEQAIARGIEAEVEGRTSFGLELFATVTTQFGAIATNAPRTQVKGRVAQGFAGDRATAALESIYQTDRTTLAGTVVPGQALTNLVFTAQKFWKGLRVAAVVQNLFDTTLADPGGPEHRQDRIPLPGRQFLLKLEYAFQ
jgi:outer membrane receptor for ferrienterochelin and colicins